MQDFLFTAFILVAVALIIILLGGSLYAMFGNDPQFYCDWSGFRYSHLNCK
jgi:hypothetical protein